MGNPAIEAGKAYDKAKKLGERAASVVEQTRAKQDEKLTKQLSEIYEKLSPAARAIYDTME